MNTQSAPVDNFFRRKFNVPLLDVEYIIYLGTNMAEMRSWMEKDFDGSSVPIEAKSEGYSCSVTHHEHGCYFVSLLRAEDASFPIDDMYMRMVAEATRMSWVMADRMGMDITFQMLPFHSRLVAHIFKILNEAYETWSSGHAAGDLGDL